MNKQTSSMKRLSRAFLSKNELGAVLPLILLLVVVASINPNFFAPRNLLDILRTAAFSFIVAIPLTFLLSSQGMDLSVGAVTSLGGVVCAMALKAGVPLPVAILLALGAGAIAGAINGVLIIYSNLPPFIATMGTQYAFNGFIAIITQNLAISNFESSFKVISQYKLFDLIPMPILYAIILGILAQILLTHTRFGREIFCVRGTGRHFNCIPLRQRPACRRQRYRAFHYGRRDHWRHQYVWWPGHRGRFSVGLYFAGDHYQRADSDERLHLVGKADLRHDPDHCAVCGQIPPQSTQW